MSGAAAGAIIQGLGELGGNIVGSAALAMNRDIAYRNYNWGKYGMMANLLLQGEQFKRQDEQWRREDSAIQRRVADLKKAGLSPVLAAGQGASSSPPSAPMRVEPPENKFQMPYNAFKMPDVVGMINSLLLTQSQIEKNDAETQKLNQNRSLDLLTFPSRLANLNAKNSNLYQEIQTKVLNNMLFKMSGVSPTNASEVGKLVRDIVGTYSTVKEGLNKGKVDKNNNHPAGSGEW